jgi:hypothetical protein
MSNVDYFYQDAINRRALFFNGEVANFSLEPIEDLTDSCPYGLDDCDKIIITIYTCDSEIDICCDEVLACLLEGNVYKIHDRNSNELFIEFIK